MILLGRVGRKNFADRLGVALKNWVWFLSIFQSVYTKMRTPPPWDFRQSHLYEVSYRNKMKAPFNHMKHGTQTILQYARSFIASIKESVKSLVTWSAHYFTGSRRWYPLSKTTLHSVSWTSLVHFLPPQCLMKKGLK